MKYTEQIIFILSCTLVFWQAWGQSPDSVTNYKKGLLAVVFVIFIESLLKGEIIFFKRNNAFWRAMLRVALLYLCALVFLAFQNANDARQLISILYPELGKPIGKDMHTYDDECDLSWANIWDNFDHYYAIHLFNWFMATLVVRDRWMMHFWHVYCEVIELSWEHILPHFAECWWDHILTDILLSNVPAVEFGLWVIDKLKWKKYDWLGIKGTKHIWEWDVFHNHRRFAGTCQYIITVTVNFLCGFFLINSLWIPPVNSFNVFRLLIWFSSSNMSFRELYNDIETWGTYERINNPVSGKARWITLFLCIAEVYVSVKFIDDAGNWNKDFHTPIYNWLSWTIFGVLMASFYIYLRFYGQRIQKYPPEYYTHRENSKNKKEAKEKVLISQFVDSMNDSNGSIKVDEIQRKISATSLSQPEKDKKDKKSESKKNK